MLIKPRGTLQGNSMSFLRKPVSILPEPYLAANRAGLANPNPARVWANSGPESSQTG
jgi:hypothetical protein